jgi:hypothetical protein
MWASPSHLAQSGVATKHPIEITITTPNVSHYSLHPPYIDDLKSKTKCNSIGKIGQCSHECSRKNNGGKKSIMKSETNVVVTKSEEFESVTFVNISLGALPLS